MQFKSLAALGIAALIGVTAAVPTDHASNGCRDKVSGNFCGMLQFEAKYWDRLRKVAKPDQYCWGCDDFAINKCYERNDLRCVEDLEKHCKPRGGNLKYPYETPCLCNGLDECDRLAGTHKGDWQHVYGCEPGDCSV